MDNLFPYFLRHARQAFPHLDCLEDLKKISDLRTPANWFVYQLFCFYCLTFLQTICLNWFKMANYLTICVWQDHNWLITGIDLYVGLLFNINSCFLILIEKPLHNPNVTFKLSLSISWKMSTVRLAGFPWPSLQLNNCNKSIIIQLYKINNFYSGILKQEP